MSKQTASGPSQRMLRVGEQVRHALSDVLQRGEVRDDVIESTVISISEVRMSPDLKIATAFVSPLAAKDNDAMIKALARNAKFIRGRVSGALRQMRSMPEFRFRLDTSYDNMAKIDQLLRSPEVARDLAEEERRKIMSRPRKKKGRPVSGWVIFDKPVGMGSTEAVSKVKWLFQADKAGHAGTLDPLASGMLPIALGEATKTVPYVQDGAKVYRFTVAWGEERTTDDLEGPVTKTSDKPPSDADIRAIMPNYTGVIMQTPPQFSAIKIGGERAYDLAREGEAVDIPAREVEIGRFDLIERTDGTRLRNRMRQGHLCAVSGARHGPRPGLLWSHIATLRRTEVDPFVAGGSCRDRRAGGGQPDATREVEPEADIVPGFLRHRFAAGRYRRCAGMPAASGVTDDAAHRSASATRSSFAVATHRSMPRRHAPRRAAGSLPSAQSKPACSSRNGSLPDRLVALACSCASGERRHAAWEFGHKKVRRRAKISPLGASPGTLVADPLAKQPVMTLTVISPETWETVENATLEDVRADRGKWPIVWLDCAGLADVELISEIGKVFGLHPLALEDTVNTGQRPKADFFDTMPSSCCA